MSALWIISKVSSSLSFSIPIASERSTSIPSYVMGESDTADCPAGGVPVESSVAWREVFFSKLRCLCCSNGGIWRDMISQNTHEYTIYGYLWVFMVSQHMPGNKWMTNVQWDFFCYVSWEFMENGGKCANWLGCLFCFGQYHGTMAPIFLETTWNKRCGCQQAANIVRERQIWANLYRSLTPLVSVSMG